MIPVFLRLPVWLMYSSPSWVKYSFALMHRSSFGEEGVCFVFVTERAPLAASSVSVDDDCRSYEEHHEHESESYCEFPASTSGTFSSSGDPLKLHLMFFPSSLIGVVRAYQYNKKMAISAVII